MPSWKCLCCGQVGCKPSTCPKGDPDAQKELANKRAEIEKANRERAAQRFQGAVDVSEDEARRFLTKKTMKIAWCLLTRLSLHPAIPICHPKCLRGFWGLSLRPAVCR